MGSDNDNNGIVDKTREFIHETVKTDEQRQAEKPIMEKIKDKVPSNAEEAGAGVGGAIDGVVNDFTTKFQERLDEDRPEGEKLAHKDEKNKGLLGATQDKIKDVRETIYDKTKSEEEKRMDKPFLERVTEVREAKDGKTEPAIMMS